jgi:hypothetical protein
LPPIVAPWRSRATILSFMQIRGQRQRRLPRQEEP